MSILGPSSLPALGLAGSAAAGLQRPANLTDRDKADQAIQKRQSDQVRLNNRDLDDSVETDFSHGQVSDRDPDGRLPWQEPGTAPEETQTETPPGNEAPRLPDEDRGHSIDIDV